MSNPTTHPGHNDQPTHPALDLDVLQRCLGVGPAENEREDYLARAAADLVAEVRRLRSALVTLDEQFLARRDAIDSNDSRGTPGGRARMAWEDAARAVRAVAS